MPQASKPLSSSSSASARQFDLIAFDWDGTLYDSTAIIARCIQESVRDVGGQVPSTMDASYVIGLGLEQALAHAAPDVSASRHKEMVLRFEQHYARHAGDVSLFDGVLAMLAQLKARGHTIAVATGMSRVGLNALLQAPQLQGVFDSSRTADETSGKPHPQMLHELMREFGVAPERTLMIGDTTHDLKMAQNACCASVAVSYGAHEPSTFHSLGPRFVAHSVPELQAWFAQHA